ncbi:MAG: hypothetical protein A2939_05055 [Parcubacteria group bacterium RIFCSPLOWO2_01_FULL_48_18]|nr:MAG: hypothetical protein A3J67_03470 [Parcubacteria group bacterium RIFCSPHIGHO2_02_FULL_48_10b]OHB22236.1 MAG: hypothetical protein A2939_05055 [Parcubacteria group bacterium RIFCSPLOWO2_01_FULL_48_18]
MRIFIDDLREAPEGYRVARNFQEFRKSIEEAVEGDEVVEAISFDNDLGEGEREGYEIMKWLAESYPQYMVGETEITIHSANPRGRENMEAYIEFCRKHREDLLEMKSRKHPWGEMENE